MARSILITGATGKQGGAVLSSLLDLPGSPFRLVAVTRSPDSDVAKSLVAKSPTLISVIGGNLDDPDAIFAAAGGHGTIWGVFSVQAGFKNEELQGKALVDSAVKHGVSHFIYSSVDRGGSLSDENPTDIPHFITKHHIEKHLKDVAPRHGMSWVILRPTAFFENVTPNFFGKIFAAAWKWQLPPSKPLQLVSCTDIGFFAAQAFANPEQWHNRSLSLAGDELTFTEASEIFKEVTGEPAGLPVTYWFLQWALVSMVKNLKTMFKFFAEMGYAADVGELRKMNPKMLDWKAWLQQSAFAKK
ncbi:hypothetical protein FGG08_001565 [Glutinoglossum americanum]|uniref:NmrA-like domain-containing protein n=1 Tax=Glutinoglossum americanum TaxID=1670608 RepID=A0A9P8L666_9PEZI|nr:hypothetical protein FGG08_001565 [Glutinoglossum americanum]